MLGVFVLLAVIASERTFCVPCAGAHALVLAHAGLVLFAWRRLGLPRPGPGAVLGAGSLLWGYLVVVFTTGGVPASSIPTRHAAGLAGRYDAARLHHQHAGRRAGRCSPTRSAACAAGPRSRCLRRACSAARRTAPVRFTEFTDVRCSHCATLHQAWEQLEKSLPPDSFSLESRYYPLDGGCNPVIRAPARDPVRCLAPRVQICRELDPGAHALAGALFAEQRTLTPQRVYELAGGDRAALDACVASPRHRAQAGRRRGAGRAVQPRWDAHRAGERPPGQRASRRSCTRSRWRAGSPDHPAFSVLPPPNPAAHIH